MSNRRASEQYGAWAIVLVDAQRTIPGVKATDRRTFRGTVRAFEGMTVRPTVRRVH